MSLRNFMMKSPSRRACDRYGEWPVRRYSASSEIIAQALFPVSTAPCSTSKNCWLSSW